MKSGTEKAWLGLRQMVLLDPVTRFGSGFLSAIEAATARFEAKHRIPHGEVAIATIPTMDDLEDFYKRMASTGCIDIDPDVRDDLGARMTNELAAVGAYRQTKTVFRLTDPLGHALLDAGWPSGAPMGRFALPLNGMVVAVPESVMRRMGGGLSAEDMAYWAKSGEFVCFMDYSAPETGPGLEDRGRPELAIQIMRALPIERKAQVQWWFAQAARIGMTHATLDEEWDALVTIRGLHKLEGDITADLGMHRAILGFLMRSIAYIGLSGDVACDRASLESVMPPKGSSDVLQAQWDLRPPRFFTVGRDYDADPAPLRLQ